MDNTADIESDPTAVTPLFLGVGIFTFFILFITVGTLGFTTLANASVNVATAFGTHTFDLIESKYDAEVLTDPSTVNLSSDFRIPDVLIKADGVTQTCQVFLRAEHAVTATCPNPLPVTNNPLDNLSPTK